MCIFLYVHMYTYICIYLYIYSKYVHAQYSNIQCKNQPLLKYFLIIKWSMLATSSTEPGLNLKNNKLCYQCYYLIVCLSSHKLSYYSYIPSTSVNNHGLYFTYIICKVPCKVSYKHIQFQHDQHIIMLI